MNMAQSINTQPSSLERRGRSQPRPERLDKVLSFEQSVTVTAKGQFGWSVAFIRRPLFQQPEVVLVNPSHSEYLIIDEEGGTRPFYNVRTEDFT